MEREELLRQARVKLTEAKGLLADAEEHEVSASAFELANEEPLSS